MTPKTAPPGSGDATVPLSPLLPPGGAMQSFRPCKLRAMKCVHAPAGADPVVVEIKGELAEIQQLVGGYLEPVTGDGWHAYFDEDGRMKGLPVNVRASAFLRHMGWRGQYVVGDVVFLGDTPEGEETDLPEEILVQIVH